MPILKVCQWSGNIKQNRVLYNQFGRLRKKRQKFLKKNLKEILENTDGVGYFEKKAKFF